MKCTCGHDESQHQELDNKLACFVILSRDGNFNNYCQCMKYKPSVDKDAQLVSLREAGEKMANRFKLNSILEPLCPEDAAALAEWEAANK